MKVRNFESPRSGRPVANQFIITHNGYAYFQSYDTIIVKLGKGKVVLDENAWNYSKTTGKYRNEFLGESIAETRKKIESGEYELADLN